MHLKDHYSILEIAPSATLAEIKKAYRKLAQQLHPDKNANDPYAAARFAAVKEAYEVLTNPQKKAHYLQQRWYDQSMGKRKTQEIITPVSLLKQSLELNRQVAQMDVHRMDRQGLLEYMLSQFDDSSLEQLGSFKEPSIIEQIIISTLKTAEVFKTDQLQQIAAKLSRLAALNSLDQERIEKALRTQRRKESWEKMELVIVILITLIICVLIFLGAV
ncbi:MAG TPA: J domain-containing protein [Chitinophagaceae bacterium]|nr:J domain-containing protein [Chitinophagaceae bacterium]